MSYQIKLDVFEGPFNLLLHLIKKDEIDIYNIPIAKITCQYLDYIKLMQNLNLEITGEFLVMAGTLLYIKSRMLLPSGSDTLDEAYIIDEDEDPRKELVQQLLEYKRFKESAKLLEIKEIEQREVFHRINSIECNKREQIIEVSLFDLIDAFKKILRSGKKEIKEIILEEITVEQKIEEILNKIKNKNYINFSEAFSRNLSKQELIATFLALLELIRLKEIKVRQIKLFGEIRIYRVRDIKKENQTKQLEFVELNSEKEKQPAVV